MNECTALRALTPLFKGEAQVVKSHGVGVETLEVGPVYGDQLRGEVQHLPQRGLLFTDLVFPPLSVLDVGEDAIPFDNPTDLVAQRDAPLQMPAVLPICAAKT